MSCACCTRPSFCAICGSFADPTALPNTTHHLHLARQGSTSINRSIPPGSRGPQNGNDPITRKIERSRDKLEPPKLAANPSAAGLLGPPCKFTTAICLPRGAGHLPSPASMTHPGVTFTVLRFAADRRTSSTRSLAVTLRAQLRVHLISHRLRAESCAVGVQLWPEAEENGHQRFQGSLRGLAVAARRVGIRAIASL